MKQLKIICWECKTENEPDAVVCKKCGSPLLLSEPPDQEHTIICPRCQQKNDSRTFFCYACGKYFVDAVEAKLDLQSKKRKRDAPQSPAIRAKVIMPGGSEITLTGAPIFIERSDFDSTLPNDLLMCISRQHILITYSKEKYYIQDYGHNGKGSTNHTKLNGIDIYGKRKKALKDGDKIELAGQSELTLTFNLLKE